MVDSDRYESFSKENVEQLFADKRSSQEELELPVVVGEWGAFPSKDFTNDLIRHMNGILERYLWSSAYWEYHPGMEDDENYSSLCRAYPMEAAGNFETGLLSGTNFQAGWITHSFAKEETACPVFVRTISLKKAVKRARIYATALGVYEIQLDRKKVGDAFFAPGWTNYKKRLQYQTYDVTGLLNKNEGSDHTLEIMVGNGWYKGIFGFTCTLDHYGEQTALLAELHILYEDGSKEVVATDRNWQVKTGSVRYSEIYMGETIDSTFSDDKPVVAIPFSYPMENITAQECEPVRITKRTPAKELILTPKGEKVLDFGQNMAGFVEVTVEGKAGQKIVVRHAETLDKDGNFYPETLRQAKSADTYICDGTRQTFLPHFTFHGFRYICVEGLDEVNPADFTACTLHTDMRQTGSFSCSNAMVNQLQSNIQWGQRSNFLDIPTV